MKAKDAWGKYGEDVAAQHLQTQGFVVLERNWRCDVGEIDIVARDGDTLVVCEVKTRTSRAFGAPLEAVTAQKAARLRRLAAGWMRSHDVRPKDVRIDLVGVICGQGEPQIEHVRGAL